MSVMRRFGRLTITVRMMMSADRCPLCSRSGCQCVAIAARVVSCWLRAGGVVAFTEARLPRPPRCSPRAFPFIDSPAKSLVALAGLVDVLQGGA